MSDARLQIDLCGQDSQSSAVVLPRGRGRLPSALLAVFEPTGSLIGGVIGGAASKGACWKLTRAAKYLVLEAEGWLKGACF